MVHIAGVSGTQLKQFLERIEFLEEQKANVAGDIRDVFGEAKASGFDVKIMRQVLKVRKMNREELAEQEELLNLYLQALDKTDETRTA